MVDFQKRFIDEALELLTKLEKDLLSLETKPDDASLTEEIFRGLHTLKGSSAMYGFEKIGRLTHQIENIFERVRGKELTAECNIISLTLNVADFIATVLKSGNDIADNFSGQHQELLEQVKKYTKCASIDSQNNGNIAVALVEGLGTYWISFSVDNDFEKRGVKLEPILNQLEKLGKLISIPIQNENGGTYWDVFLVCQANILDIEDILIMMLDIAKIEKIASGNLFQHNEFNSLLKKNTSLKRANNLDELKASIQSKLKPSVISQQTDITKTALLPQINSGFLRVAAEKLDEQMDLLSELVTAKAELRLVVEQERYTKLNKLVESIDKVTNRFRKNILNVRLVQVKNWYVLFLRLVRDLSKQLNKNVELLAEGLETEIDKNIIDSLEGPLTHLIRNCLDHGIETPEEREKLNKPIKGVITLKALHSGSSIIIEIKDDGRGINKEKVRTKAISKGLIDRDADLTDKQIFDLLFLPGFSTSDSISEISGRGVGMDIVKKAVNMLRGEIEIRSTEGVGTNIVIKLPMFLSIIDTLLIRTGNQYFAVSLPEVSKCTQLKKNDLEKSENDLIQIDNELIPYVNLRQLFNINGKEPERQKLVVVESYGIRYGIIIDEVIGEYQAVLKPFDGYYINKQYLVGASLMANGNLCIILDTSKLLHNMIEKTL